MKMTDLPKCRSRDQSGAICSSLVEGGKSRDKAKVTKRRKILMQIIPLHMGAAWYLFGNTAQV